MTTLFLMPRTSNRQVTTDPRDNVGAERPLRIGAWTRQRGKKVDVRQSSVEMALVVCTSEGRIPRDKTSKSVHQEIRVGQEFYLPISSPSSYLLPAAEDVIIAEERIDECPTRKSEERTGESREDKGMDFVEARHGDEHGRRRREEKRHSSWWKDNRLGQIIVCFFARILGRREAARKFDANVDRGIDKENRGRRDDDGIGRPTRALKLYTANETSRGACRADASRQEMASMLVRQIQRTRDKNLRITLLEQELHARLPGESPAYGKVFDETLTTRQLSSPLC
ncbi:hypothetical protein KM043_009923 [Ampulex compressa]|nr:hypothetical protein KM043_009923 [Ampulex compressa]